MELSKYNVGDFVKITANDDWKGSLGVVHKKVKDVLQVFCILQPNYLYPQFPKNI